MKHVSVVEATHVKYGGRWEKIVAKTGIDRNGKLAPPSAGGFSVVTESGKTISMWVAQAYDKRSE